MARVTVTPREFQLVSYDPDRIAELASEVADKVGLPADCEILVEIDETSPLGRASLAALEPVTIAVHSGAFEHAKRPRHMSDQSTRDVLGRLLHRARDRLDPTFGRPPPDDELTLKQSVAWDAYCVGRCERLGYTPSKPRRNYHFRIRHGFSDLSDAVFERLWSSDELTWSDIEAACAKTEAAPDEAAAG